ncbi:integrin-linked protein kinase 1-like protein isoform X1 [Tanacetum coccineum]
MEQNQQVRFTLGKQSSLSPNAADDDDGLGEIDPRVRLMFVCSEGDLDGIKKLLSSGTDVNFRDIDDRTALHVAACNGFSDVAEMLISGGADVEAKDKWGSTLLRYWKIGLCPFG